jgi:hypothetical protein
LYFNFEPENEEKFITILSGKPTIIFNSTQQIFIEYPIWTFINIANDLFEPPTESRTNLVSSFDDSSPKFWS